ncbi:selenoprotein W [Cryptococcus deuterogattii 99/473]|uniref:Selenoprotein W n=1 Tax=Cryptococcus deuterogattii Ram5 TaxID=1296110 RepID=A0A0D0V2J0_9TREE|nr:selenoprotein W [Cryptococcus deuterogattii LA55]KIR32941.1 selenoprotein W [Cryptococcus deuterogattii MMRL2647]KIR39130.1 selenoprotein W [Cryptococcus deuterogattii Ram5]KIR71268.1 selenoprotein W [Cryptococcus deuterogattii CA1014]KIR94552.1 selenoprotein W [Cryptococcus deuterogattii CBS 10090]KIS00923.1 selenoprotein W [Cryptococcus deuterogattii 2001/935-1]KIY57632.1 selenoprotein W [Cryptococcus deuterogattii 99/473]
MSETCKDCDQSPTQPASSETMSQNVISPESSLPGADVVSSPTSSYVSPQNQAQVQTAVQPSLEVRAGQAKVEGVENKDESTGTSIPLTPAITTQTGQDFKSPDSREVKPSVVIEFCDRCRWAPRATWIQTELFLTFPNPILRSITLMPLNAPETGGRFRVWVDVGKGKGDELVWDRKVRLEHFHEFA